LSVDHKKKLSSVHKGKKLSEEHKKVLSKKTKEYWDRKKAGGNK